MPPQRRHLRLFERLHMTVSPRLHMTALPLDILHALPNSHPTPPPPSLSPFAEIVDHRPIESSTLSAQLPSLHGNLIDHKRRNRLNYAG
jgi:hypothetical protein